MIALLRAASFLSNCGCVAGLALLCGAGWAGALTACVVFFAWSFQACGREPATAAASDGVTQTAEAVAARMGVAAPRDVRMLPGRTAAALRSGRGYMLLLGREVPPEHAEALLAHEIAHVKSGDIFMEPFTDGPARLLLPVARACALFWIAVFPFLLFGTPLARITELRADQIAAHVVPSYPAVLKAFMSSAVAHSSLLYPSLGTRLRRTARNSLNTGTK